MSSFYTKESTVFKSSELGTSILLATYELYMQFACVTELFNNGSDYVFIFDSKRTVKEAARALFVFNQPGIV